MLSSVLRSKRAEKVNIVIIDTFVKLRELLSTHKDLLIKIEEIERRTSSNDHQIMVLFKHLKKLLAEKQAKEIHENRPRIRI